MGKKNAKRTATDVAGPRHHDASLRGVGVLVTRPQNQSTEITEALQALGARVIHFPMIAVRPPSDWAAIDQAITHISSFDWVIFTSANGARFFFGRLNEIDPAASAVLARRHICAIGPATARAVTDAGYQVTVIPSDLRAEGVLKALSRHVGGQNKMAGLRFLIPRAKIARDILPNELARMGACVEIVEAYETVMPDVDGRSLLRLLREEKIGAITFTSSSTVANFLTLAAEAGFSGILEDVVVACIGPITARTAAESGMKNIVQAEPYTAEALVRALADALSTTARSSD